MYLYPAMFNYEDAIKQNSGYCYDAFVGYSQYPTKAIVEYNNSIAAWLATDKSNLRLLNVVRGVPIVGKTISPDVDNNFRTIKEAIMHYNEENNNAIRSYLSINS